MEYALTTANLSKSYGKRRALVGCSLNVPVGSLYCLCGLRGAGKTTLLRILCGLQKPTVGSYTILGAHSASPSLQQARRYVGAVLGTPSLIGRLSAAGNLEAHARLYGRQAASRPADILRLTGLAAAGAKPVRNFTLGMRRRLAIGCAVLAAPRLLLLDDPAAGLDPAEVSDVCSLISRIHRAFGTTVLMTASCPDAIGNLPTHLGWLNKGILEGTVEQSGVSATAFPAPCSLAASSDCQPPLAPKKQQLRKILPQFTMPGEMRS
ncbi:MAG: ABC transporter ATP-binding protein [Clostridia bacterium]|nr:ABC transporter ATP-binding protein [Clostridia bacterium]